MHRTRNRLVAAVASTAVAVLTANAANAATLSWLGGTGALTDANYTDGTTSGLSAAAGDTVQIGAGGVVTQSSGALSYGKLRVGHNDTTAGAFTGTGNVTINNGATVNLTAGASGIANAALWVGNVQNGVLTIDGLGSRVTSNRLVAIGIGNNVNRSGTLNITNGGALVISLGNLALGDRAGSTGNGVQGHVNISGDGSSITFEDNTGDLNIGARGATSSFTMAGGTVSGLDVVDVGMAGGASTGSFFTISGGTFSHGANFFVGRGDSVDSTANLSGGALNTGGRFLVGGGNATGNRVNHTDGILNTTLDVRVGDANTLATATNTYNFSGDETTSRINATTGMYVGRQATGTFNQSGGTATLGGALQIGNRENATGAATGLYTISDGALVVNAGTNTALSIAPKGTGEFRVVGDDGVIDLNGNFLAASTVDGVGTLAFEFEAGDGLSLVDVSGTATFGAGAVLAFDTTNAEPTQTTYDLLTATDIVDNGLVLTAPAGWSYQIVPGGNGEILQLAIAVPEPASLGLLVTAALPLLNRRRRA